ncbi:MAG TPA: NAD(P)/FAD-dependent oxidoreductase [Micropepsaceae bacterium]|nr:NAD(P)/FAD-dependent oxidoreductase [Micropepsaceae bacterium]
MTNGALLSSGSTTRDPGGAQRQGEQQVVIAGAGFAGMEVAKALRGAPAHVTLIDRHNYTLFQPLLYQVASAALSPADVAMPIRALLHGSNIEMLLDEVEGIETERSHVRTRSGRRLHYDVLVLATGSEFNYFGRDDWHRVAPAPKGLADAVEIRRRLLLAFEQAEMCEKEVERSALMTFVIVGAGATGVEMAGAIAELAKATLQRDFRNIDPASARIFLVEAGPRILSGYPNRLAAYAARTLTRMGVQILLNHKVEQLDTEGILAAGQRIESRTVIWGAGVKAAPVAEWLRVKPGRHGGVKVNTDFSVDGFHNIYVIGDAAESAAPDGQPLPGLAAVAKQEGKYLGDLLQRRLNGDWRSRRFKYRDYGTMATIGRSAAVADLRGFHITGTMAWLLWGAVHLFYLIGFRNRVVVLVNWFWAWLTYAHGARLITDSPSRYVELNPASGHVGPPVVHSGLANIEAGQE